MPPKPATVKKLKRTDKKDITENPENSQRKALLERTQELKELISAERKELLYYQKQGEAITAQWELSRKEAQKLHCELRIQKHTQEDVNERHRSELLVETHQIKHLSSEHQNENARLTAENIEGLQLKEEELKLSEADLLTINKELRERHRETERTQEDLMHSFRMAHDERTTNLRKENERKIRDLQSKNDAVILDLRRQLNDELFMKTKEVEDEKNKIIKEMITSHELAFFEMKSYFDDIFLNTSENMKLLKDQSTELSREDHEKTKLLRDLKNIHKDIINPLKEAKTVLEELSEQQIKHSKAKAEINKSTEELKELTQEIATTKWDIEVLTQKLQISSKERDEQKAEYFNVLRVLQQRANVRFVILSQRLHSLREQIETKDVQLNEVIRSANIDVETSLRAQRYIDGIVNEKNQMIRDLQYELAKAAKTHDRLRSQKERMHTEFGMDTEPLGFEPKDAQTLTHTLTHGAEHVILDDESENEYAYEPNDVYV